MLSGDTSGSEGSGAARAADAGCISEARAPRRDVTQENQTPEAVSGVEGTSLSRHAADPDLGEV